jgi:hypothetical protein
LDGDGSVRVADAILALRIAVGLLTPSSSQQAIEDVNGDGALDVKDVTLILQRAIGL